jgi:hypothetical protein
MRYGERGMKVQLNKLVPHNGVVTSQENKNIRFQCLPISGPACRT